MCARPLAQLVARRLLPAIVRPESRFQWASSCALGLSARFSPSLLVVPGEFERQRNGVIAAFSMLLMMTLVNYIADRARCDKETEGTTYYLVASPRATRPPRDARSAMIPRRLGELSKLAQGGISWRSVWVAPCGFTSEHSRQ